MVSSIVLTSLFIIIALSAWYLFIWPRQKRARIVNREFPVQWEGILVKSLPIYTQLADSIKQELHGHIQVFLSEKEFVGCAGLAVTEKMRVIIAAQACLLVLNRPSRSYSGLHYIYIYPSSFKVNRTVRDELGLVSEQSHHLLGESWDSGKVILAWDQVAEGVRNFKDGHNVVLHEFAHQLDHESGVTNGAPLLYTQGAYKQWAQVLAKEFESLQRLDPAQRSVIDQYGATNPAEFFAVATETFFEEPERMSRHHQELFDQLKAYYRIDPRDWSLVTESRDS